MVHQERHVSNSTPIKRRIRQKEGISTIKNQKNLSISKTLSLQQKRALQQQYQMESKKVMVIEDTSDLRSESTCCNSSDSDTILSNKVDEIPRSYRKSFLYHRHSTERIFENAWHEATFTWILQQEQIIRLILTDGPNIILHYVNGLRQFLSFVFIYTMLQALALLWGFLFNIGAILGEGMVDIITMPYLQALCVLFIHGSVIGILLSFGRAAWILAWQSLNNFPWIRHMIAYECRPQAVIIITALPLLGLLCTLILVPTACNDLGHDTTSPMKWSTMVCEHSYLRLLTEKHTVFQRALKLSTFIGFIQFIQTSLDILPKWKKSLAGLSWYSTAFLGGWLLLLKVVGCLWFVEWLARHTKLQITPLSGFSTMAWNIFGMVLMIAVILWILVVTIYSAENVTECQVSQTALSRLFERLKYTFAVVQMIIFIRASLHPDMGFVHAQLELTIIDLFLPTIYVVCLVALRTASLVSVKLVLICAPIAVSLAAIVYKGSKMSQIHSFFVLSVFFFDRALRFMGKDAIQDSINDIDHARNIPYTIQQMLRQTVGKGGEPLLGHKTAKKIVYMAFGTLFTFVAALSGVSILSGIQRHVKWFPDATSVVHHENSIDISHTAVVKLHLGLTDDTTPAMTGKKSQRYAACANEWDGLTLVDFALLAEAAYFNPNSTDISTFVDSMFKAHSPGIIVRLPPSNSKTGSKLDFFEAYLPAINTSIISVRGTDIWRFTDFIEDVKMFMEPVIFTILSAIFPTIRIWPDVTFSTLIELYSELVSLFGLQHGSWCYHELLEYVASIKDREVYLTGHSMGGGIARLVGSIVSKPSITFSPPGFVQSYSKLVHEIGGKAMKVDRSRLHYQSVAVIPEYDPVTMIDAQAGMVQKISCDTPHLSMQLSCHMLEGTLCNLLERCGDTHNRISSCNFKHTISSFTEEIPPAFLIWQVVRPELLVPIVMIISMILSILIRHQSRQIRHWMSKSVCIKKFHKLHQAILNDEEDEVLSKSYERHERHTYDIDNLDNKQPRQRRGHSVGC